MSSSTAEEPELKGGHPPAVKAGGMRVARPKQNSTGDTKDKAEMTKEELEEYGAGTSPPKVDKVLVSGAVAKEDKAFPPEAVKHFHEHPLPSKDHRPVQQKHNINQPK
jgi:hypothetical protein